MYVRLLGQVAVGADRSSVVPVTGAVPGSVLAHLSLAQGRVLSVEELARRVWDDQPANPRNALQAAVMRLRRTCPPGTIVTVPDGYRIGGDVRVDLREAARGLAEARRLLSSAPADAEARAQQVLDLFVGEPLAGLGSLASGAARSGIEDVQVAALLLRADALLLDGRAGLAVGDLREAVSSHPLAEPLHAALIRALAAASRPGEAIEHAGRVRALLADQLGTDPSAEVIEAFDAVLGGWSLEELVLRRVRPSATMAVRVVVPNPPVSLVGREVELTRLGALMADHRLVTVTGLGGVGKTTLAAALARETADRTSGHVVMVDASEQRSGGDLLRTIGRAWGSMAEASDVTDALALVIGGRPALLVLDNCRSPEVGAVVDSLLAAVPALRVLATSREPLGASEEAIAPLHGLDVTAAIRLLRMRAREHGVDIGEVADADQSHLVRCVDGIPLAVELLAARVVSNGARALLDELVGSPWGMAKAIGMDEVVDASWDGLDEEAATLLAHLGDLPDGLSRDHAASLLSSDPDDPLRRLAGSGLAVRSRTAPPRWVAPDMVRDHMRGASDHDGRCRRANAVLAHYADVHSQFLHGVEPMRSVEPPCVQERGNLAQAWQRRDGTLDPDTEARALLLLAGIELHLDLTEPALARECDALRYTAPRALAGWLDMVVARHLHRAGEQDAAIARAWSAVRTAREAEDRELESVCLRGIAHGLLMKGREQDALELARLSTSLAESVVRAAPDRIDARKIAIESRRLLAGCLSDCGRPDAEVAAEYDAALVEARAIGRPQLVLPDLATWAADAGLASVAASSAEELRRCCTSDDVYDLAHADVADALRAWRRGEPEAMSRHTLDALARFRVCGDLRWVGSCVWMLAECSAFRGEQTAAAVLLGVRLSVVRDPVGEPDADALQRRLATELGAVAFDALVEEGRILGLDGALRLVRTD